MRIRIYDPMSKRIGFAQLIINGEEVRLLRNVENLSVEEFNQRYVATSPDPERLALYQQYGLNFEQTSSKNVVFTIRISGYINVFFDKVKAQGIFRNRSEALEEIMLYALGETSSRRVETLANCDNVDEALTALILGTDAKTVSFSIHPDVQEMIEYNSKQLGLAKGAYTVFLVIKVFIDLGVKCRFPENVTGL